MTPTPPNRPPAGAPTESGPKCNREPVVTETSLIVFSTNSPNSQRGSRASKQDGPVTDHGTDRGFAS